MTTTIKDGPVRPRNRHDQPVKMAQFERSVENRKILLGILIPFGLAIRILLLVLNKDNRGWPGEGALDTTIWGWVNLGLMASRLRWGCPFHVQDTDYHELDLAVRHHLDLYPLSLSMVVRSPHLSATLIYHGLSLLHCYSFGHHLRPAQLALYPYTPSQTAGST